jgi:putative transposase
MDCVRCGSAAVAGRPECTARGYRRFRCRECGKQSDERSGGCLNRTQCPSDVVALVVLWRLRHRLTLRDLAEMFLIHGLVFSHEAVRGWEAKLAPVLAGELRRRRHGRGGARGWHWRVDGTYPKVRGRWCYLYRAIDRDGDLVDTMLGEHRDMAAAQAFFRSAKAATGVTPGRVTTDGHGSYPRAIRTVLGRRVVHRTSAYRNTDWSKTTAA